VHNIYEVAELQAIKTKLTRTIMPDGTRLNLQPLPVDIAGGPRELSFAPRYGEHSRAILEEVGLDDVEIEHLVKAGVVHAQSDVRP
jgi:crotonobetainyl-CoA:carnitine CoA-transferase CaiB-like acyl-CoA transferase